MNDHDEPRQLGYAELLRMQGELGTPYNRAIWNIHSTSGRLNIVRGLAVLSAGALAGYAATVHGPASPVAVSATVLTLGSIVHFVLANLLSLRIIVVAEWVLRLGRGDLDYRVRLAGQDQLAWMCEALERLRRRSIEVVKLPEARALAQALEAQNRELEDQVQRLKRTRDQLIAQHKANEMGELAAGVAHEVRNPLNFVQNFAELGAEMTLELREEAEEHATSLGTEAGQRLEALHHSALEALQAIAANARRANRIIERVVDLGETTASRDAIDLNELVAEQARIAAHRGSDSGTGGAAHAELKLDLAHGAGSVTGNARAIARVVNNLVANACDATRERIRSAGEGYAPQVRVSTERAEGRPAIVVADNGAGIDPAIAERVTEPFFTTKPPQAGAGLGLSQCQDIVREHEGRMTIASVPGQGTSVRVELR